MCKTWRELSEQEKMNVAKFVEKKIEQIQAERHSIGIYLQDDSLFELIPSIDRTDSEDMIESSTVNYFCKECNELIAEDEDLGLDYKMIEHVIEHLRIN